MSNQGIGSFNSKTGIDFTSFGAGLKKTDIQKGDKVSQSIFNAIDTDKNGVIDQNEFNAFKAKIDQDSDGQVTKKEANDFLKSLKDKFEGLVGDNGKKIKVQTKDLESFLGKYKAGTDNVKSVETITDENNNSVVHVTYNDGTQEFVNLDGSKKTVGKNQDGIESTRLYDKDGNIVKEQYTDGGAEVTLDYDEDGNIIKKTSAKSVDIEDNKPAEDAGDGVETPEGTDSAEGQGTVSQAPKQRVETSVTTYTPGEEGSIPLETVKTYSDNPANKTTIRYDQEGNAESCVIIDNNTKISCTYNSEGNPIPQ